MVRYRLLGPLTVTANDGTSVDLGGRRQAAVLAALLVHANEAVPRDRLVDEVWGDSAPPTAAATLQAYVSNLRRILEPDRPAGVASRVIVRRNAGYLADVEPGELDALRFEELVGRANARAATAPTEAQADLTEALGLWRGSALVDFRDEPFAQAPAARWELIRVSARESLIDLRLAAGQHAQVRPEIEEMLREHPMRERLWGQLMIALYRSSLQTEALHAYRRLHRLLGEEMGLEPSPELQRLEHAILTHAPELSGPVPSLLVQPPAARPFPATAQPPSGHPRAPTPPAPIVGRHSELARCTAALDRARSGRGTLLLVEGEAGIGKTRLLEAILDEGRRHATYVALGRCFEGGGAPPYWPWVRIVRQLGDTPAGRELLGRDDSRLSPLHPWLTGAAEEQPELNPHLVAEAVVWLCAELARDRPLVIAVDDLHGADPDSLTVLALLAAELGLTGTVVVTTYRSADLAANHGLTDLLATVSRHDTVERVPLRRLPPGAVAELVEQVTGEPAPPGVAEEIYSRTSGNALFAVELIRLLRGGPGLVEHSPGAIPPGVRDVIRRRVAPLPLVTRSMLSVAAVFGRNFDLDIVAALVDTSELAALDALEVALAAQLVEEGDRPGLFRFSHALVQETLLDALTALRRAQLHQQLAERIETAYGLDPASWSLIAHHAVAAVVVTGPVAALAAVRRAAEQAAAAAATRLALQLRERFLALVLSMPPSAERDRLELEAQESLSTAVAVQGWVSDRLERSATRMVQLGGVTGEQSVTIAGLMTRATHRFACGRFHEGAAAVAEIDAFAAASGLPMAAICGHLNGGIAAYYLGRTAEAQRRFLAGEQLLDVVDPGQTGTVLEPPGQQSLLASYWAHRAMVTCLVGEEDRAREESALALAFGARASAATFSVSVALVLAATLHYMCDDPQLALATGRRAAADAHAAGYAELEALALVLVAWGEARTGLGSADAVREAVLAVPPTAKVEALAQWGMVANSALHAGRPEAALDAVACGLEAAAETGARMWLPELYRLRGDALRQLGRWIEATDDVDRAAELAQEMQVLLVLRRLDQRID